MTTPYIQDVSWRVLTDRAWPKDWLRSDRFNAERQRSYVRNERQRSYVRKVLGNPDYDYTAWAPFDDDDEETAWAPFDPLWLREPQVAVEGADTPLRRILLTCDSGIGKSTATAFLEYALGLADATTNGSARPSAVGLAPFALKVADLCEAGAIGYSEWLWKTLSARLADKAGCPIPVAEQVIKHALRRGKLVLLLDGLDQPGRDVAALKALLKSTEWGRARIVLASRPYALHTNWAELFEPKVSDWTFVRIDEFTEEQQRRYLGEDRFNAISVNASPIFGVPRVLSYLLTEFELEELRQIETAADIYEKVVLKLVIQGMNGASPEARLLGWDGNSGSTPTICTPRQVEHALKLLGAIAFEMTFPADANGLSTLRGPNFDKVSYDDIEAFQEMISRRYKSAAREYGGLGRDFIALAALNEVIEHGILDTDLAGLQEIQFRNRSLQEFLAARYLAKHAFDPKRIATAELRELAERDRERLWDAIFLAEEPETYAYYHIWQYLCDMPNSGVCPASWLEAVEPLYRPCHIVGGPGSTEWDAKRSSEMIFRAHYRLWKLADANNSRATEIREAWWGEFEKILHGSQGPQRRRDAESVCDGMFYLPGGTFKMGSPRELEGPIWSPTESPLSRNNEFPRRTSQSVDSFFVSRGMTSNNVFRLYRPSHGRVGRFAKDAYLEQSPYGYNDASPEPDGPVIFVSWFDAWSFAIWARWDRLSCRLPFENEWEYVAKYGLTDEQQDWVFWWGDDSSRAYCNLVDPFRHLKSPNRNHASSYTKEADPLGLGAMDLLGNGSEWCQDHYRPMYARHESDQPGSKASLRSLRGSYSSSLRERYHPATSQRVIGFRLFRAVDYCVLRDKSQ